MKKLFGIIEISYSSEGNKFCFKKLLQKGIFFNKYGEPQFTRSKNLQELHKKIKLGYRSTKLEIKKLKVYEIIK
ncbi:MAG: hypothetical protein VW298_00640 [Candidatus Woesearchaeota archaeon]